MISDYIRMLFRASENADRYAVLTHPTDSEEIVLLGTRKNIIGAKQLGDLFVKENIDVLVLDRFDPDQLIWRRCSCTGWIRSAPIYDVFVVVAENHDGTQLPIGYHDRVADAERHVREIHQKSGTKATIRRTCLFVTKTRQ